MLITRSVLAEGSFRDKLYAAAACSRLKSPCPDIPPQSPAFFLPATPHSLFSLWQSKPEMLRFWPATPRFWLVLRSCRLALRRFLSETPRFWLATRRFKSALRCFMLEMKRFKSVTRRFQLASPRFKSSARQKKAAFLERKHEPAARRRRNQINRSHHLRGGTHHA
jgi:hypothetical protein